MVKKMLKMRMMMVMIPAKDLRQSYGYLTELRPYKEVMAFYHGYEESKREGEKGMLRWNWEKALAYNPEQ